MKAHTSKFEEFVYWGTLLFAAAAVGYILVTMINDASREDTAFLQTTDSPAQAEFVTLQTNYGTIRISLDRTHAPKNARNFAALAQAGFYNKTKFHRVIKGLLIQGGDPLSRGEDRSVYGTGSSAHAVKDEISTDPMLRGVVAMVGQGESGTNGSQFFILVAPDAPLMDGKYTVIGRVTEGMDIADQISAADVDMHNTPLHPVTIIETVVE